MILPAVQALDTDFALLQEIARPKELTDQELWIGTNPRQGVGVIALHGERLKLAACYDPALRYALPVEVQGSRPFQLLAIWSMKEPVHYVPNLVAILEHYRTFIRQAPTVVAGDFNANPRFDRSHPRYLFHTITDKFSDLDLTSAYHAHHREAHGEEKTPSFFFRYREHAPFHIDYVFCPKSWSQVIEDVKVGSYGDYARFSDHRPMSVTVGPG